MGFYEYKLIIKKEIKEKILKLLIDAILFLYPIEVLGDEEEKEALEKQMAFYRRGAFQGEWELNYFFAMGYCYSELAERLTKVKKRMYRKYVLVKYAKGFGIFMIYLVVLGAIFGGIGYFIVVLWV